VETSQKIYQSKFYELPVLFEESWAKTVRAGAGIVIHGEKGRPDFWEGKRFDQVGSLLS
jgi:hypothetical protein